KSVNWHLKIRWKRSSAITRRATPERRPRIVPPVDRAGLPPHRWNTGPGLLVYMRIDPAGWPFVLGGLVVAVVVAFLLSKVVGGVLLALSLFFLFFFRDPERAVQVPESGVVSPADGRVMVAGPATADGFSDNQWQQVSIFLSPMDVHV